MEFTWFVIGLVSGYFLTLLTLWVLESDVFDVEHERPEDMIEAQTGVTDYHRGGPATSEWRPIPAHLFRRQYWHFSQHGRYLTVRGIVAQVQRWKDEKFDAVMRDVMRGGSLNFRGNQAFLAITSPENRPSYHVSDVRRCIFRWKHRRPILVVEELSEAEMDQLITLRPGRIIAMGGARLDHDKLTFDIPVGVRASKADIAEFYQK